MSESPSYCGIEPRTVQLATGTAARGVRLVRNAAGLCVVAAIGVRGDYVAMHDLTSAEPGAAASMQAGGKIVALASEATGQGDLAYSAANGKFSKTSGGGAVPAGRWVMGAAGDGVLGEVELLNPA